MENAATNAKRALNMRWSARDAGLTLLTSVCGLLAVNILLIAIDARGIFLSLAHPSILTFTLFLIQEMIFLVPMYFFIIRKYTLTLGAFGLIKLPIRTAAAWVLKGFGLMILFNGLFFLLSQRFAEQVPGFEEQAPYLPLFGSGALDTSAAILVLVILAPIIEEIVFRGFVLQTLLAKIGPYSASALSAFIFAVMHLEPASGGAIFILALILNWIFMRSRSLAPCIVFHMLNNALALTAEWMIRTGRLPV